ncbi:MAG TPA: hypothetical protein VH599_00815 [Ktedonobacterales bacterium]|jgi:hypothetical protein
MFDPGLIDSLLIEVPQEACYSLWQGLTRAMEGTLWLLESTPAGSSRV